MKKFILLTLLFLIGCGSSTPAAPNVTPEPTATLSPIGLIQRELKARNVSALVRSDPFSFRIMFDVSDNINEQFVIDGAKNDVVKILESIKESRVDYSQIFIEADYDFVDIYGNVSEEQVLSLVYSNNTIDRINFDNFSFANVYEVADRATVHDYFR